MELYLLVLNMPPPQRISIFFYYFSRVSVTETLKCAYKRTPKKSYDLEKGHCS